MGNISFFRKPNVQANLALPCVLYELYGGSSLPAAAPSWEWRICAGSRMSVYAAGLITNMPVGRTCTLGDLDFMSMFSSCNGYLLWAAGLDVMQHNRKGCPLNHHDRLRALVSEQWTRAHHGPWNVESFMIWLLRNIVIINALKRHGVHDMKKDDKNIWKSMQMMANRTKMSRKATKNAAAGNFPIVC